MDPRIRIFTKMPWIHNTGTNARIPAWNSVWPSRAREEYAMISTVMEAANGLPYWLLLEYKISTQSSITIQITHGDPGQ
jgi:hypothetical protein